MVETKIAALRGRESKILTSKRTEYGQSIRKAYESGELKEQRKNIQKLEPRNDDITNTITTVQKDNLVLENEQYEGVYTEATPDFNIGGLKDLSRTIKATRHDAGISNGKRIRNLTERECWRFMDFDDEDFDKAKAAGISNSQLYKQAGNSICVGVLEAIFRQMIPEKKDNKNEHNI